MYAVLHSLHLPQLLTFHCVIRDKYPIDATVLNAQNNSVCAGTWLN